MKFEEVLEEWEEKSAQLKKLKAEEGKLRWQLFNAAFPEPKEGVNKVTLEDGSVFKADHKINRSIDESALPEVFKQLKDSHVLPEVFKYKYSLQVSYYKKLDDDIKKIIDLAVIMKPGTPTVERV